MRFSEVVREAAKPSWEKGLRHPFVMGIVNGNLPLDTFKFYILQDIYYLKHFGKVHAMAAVQADDFRITAFLAEKAKTTAEAELTVHKQHAEALGITDEEMAQFKPAPTAYAYTSHMYRAALSGRLSETIAALLPCYWLYGEIGEINKEAQPQEPLYANWIRTYASDWFQQGVQEFVDLFDRLAEGASVAEKARMQEQFVIATEWELAFWEMAYTKEKWPSEALLV
ncbi:thiaminase II [Numidum massiliense]|uniref:thiaminase II n=1 Tax=Numidum massiliense TaxID=1522315 RepID=UPI0006D583CB|nr:thiaminase II [Numidum massiliense]